MYKTLPDKQGRQESPEMNTALINLQLKSITLLPYDPEIPLHLSKRNENICPSNDLFTNAGVIHRAKN